MARVKLDKKDQFRALLTDTAPGDVPIVFSNDGLYINLHSLSVNHSSTASQIFASLERKVLNAGQAKSSPYKYAIKKNEVSLRTLSLIHPRAQLQFCYYYKKYSDVITYLCSKSLFSIRAPYKVSNSFYRFDAEESSKYKAIDIDTLENELSRRHSSSYFSYKGHTRLYKFFNSAAYIDYEKKFSNLWMLDIANCFDSIYTHAISWAIKDKEYVKDHVSFGNQFCAQLDQLTQRSNNNETNGIPIGSEVSRIFAEILFQRIDVDIEQKLKKTFQYQFAKDYVLLRFVDDYVLFAKSIEIATTVAAVVSDCLSAYNLYINDTKMQKYQRPFNTAKSNIVSQVKDVILEFEDKVADRAIENGKRSVWPKKISKADAVIKYFIEQVKNVCHIHESSYSAISSYLISIISNRLIQLVNGYPRRIASLEEGVDHQKLLYRNLIFVYFRLLFFYYIVNPQITASQKLAKSVVIVDRFFLRHCPEFLDQFRTRLMEEIACVDLEPDRDSLRSGYVSLESLNVLIATSEFGENYLIDERRLLPLLRNEANPSYFTFVSILYYVRDFSSYSNIKSLIEAKIVAAFDQAFDLDSNSELLHLFLDSLSCPYLSSDIRAKILEMYLLNYEPDLVINAVEKTQLLQDLLGVYWFVKWKDLDLIKLLERRELNARY